VTDAVERILDRAVWLNEPARWSRQASGLSVTTDRASDFWRETLYGFTRDNGHFLGVATAGDFTAQLRVRADYDQLYDQAGLMVRLDAQHWVKTGVEFTDGARMLSTVVTCGRSDWSVSAPGGDPRDLRLRVTVAKGALRVQASLDGRFWPLLRLAPFPVAESYLVGPMCCTPERAGLEVEFSDFTVSAPTTKDLHDLS
jgi:regulation of enolase protein 1 (concanavalin A-like superfamily)